MRSLITAFPENIISALEIAKNNQLTKSYPAFNNILICGLGGSGIGGKLVANWFGKELAIPVNFCQDYEIPRFVNAKTLVIASSYSGNTEETLSAVNQAHDKGAYIIAITSGGELANFCTKFQYECILVPGGNPPRTQLAFSIVQITHVFVSLELIPSMHLENFQVAAELLLSESESIHLKAKELAAFILDKNLIIYSESKDEAIAVRARQQFNENAKILCSHHVIPEMNHNELVGWAGGRADHAVLFIHTSQIHEQNKKRFDFSQEVIENKTSAILHLHALSGSAIEESMYLINIIDWASFYLSELMQVDSVEVNVIDKLKNSLV